MFIFILFFEVSNFDHNTRMHAQINLSEKVVSSQAFWKIRLLLTILQWILLRLMTWPRIFGEGYTTVFQYKIGKSRLGRGGLEKENSNYLILLVLNGDLVDPKYVNFSLQAFLCLNLSAITLLFFFKLELFVHLFYT